MLEGTNEWSGGAGTGEATDLEVIGMGAWEALGVNQASGKKSGKH
jgi:hypothetical protein